MNLNGQLAKQRTPNERPSVRAAWIGVLLALCILGAAAAELLWGEQIVNWLGRGRIARERANIIASYRREAGTGSLPRPADTNAFEIYHLDKGPPYRMAIRVRTQSGETRRFQLVRPHDEAGTNWGFRPDNSGELEEEQIHEVIASYYRKAAAGLVPMPATTNAIRVFRAGVVVTTVSGETNWFNLVPPMRSTGTNWGFSPRAL